MDQVLELLRAGHIRDGMARLYQFLEDRRQACSRDQWRRFVQSEVLPHPVRELIHQDPVTRHSYAKPRGYSGDAVLLDYIYWIGTELAPPAQRDRVAEELFRCTTASSCAVAVRNRRHLLADLIDQVATTNPGGRVTSVACGHFREGRLSRAVARKEVTVLAIDQDPASLGAVALEYPPDVVTTRQASVRDIVTCRFIVPQSMLIYSAGLFDYLSARLARRLVRELFGSLEPGGQLLFANFLPGMPDRGFMESLADWWLIYRTEDELRGLLADVAPDQIASVTISRDSSQAVAFCTVRRASPQTPHSQNLR